MTAVNPQYPLDPHTRHIRLPSDLTHEVFHLARESGVAVAVERVRELTGASAVLAQAYVETLLRSR